MMKLILILALLISPELLAYDGNSFPLDGWRFLGYEGTDNKPTYFAGWMLLWIVAPVLTFIFLFAYKATEPENRGCFAYLLTWGSCLAYGFFLLVNLDYALGYTVGMLIFGASCALSQTKKLFD